MFFFEGSTIVHLNPKDGEEKIGILKLGTFVAGKVTMDDITEIVGSSKVRVNNKYDFSKPTNSIDRIESIGKKLLNETGTIKYCLLDFNCEHFATYLRFGLAFCEQHLHGNILKNLLIDEDYFKNNGAFVNEYELKALKFHAKRATQQFDEYVRAFELGKTPEIFIVTIKEDANKIATDVESGGCVIL